VESLKMIAVLPFENLGPAEDEYFADGLSDEIASRLSAISSIGVISRTSTIQFKKTQKTLPVVARELGVEYILEGTVRWVKTGNVQRLRITPQLIQVSGDRHLWADNFDRTLDDIFSVQTEIANRVVDALGLVLREGEKGIVEAIPTRNLDAYQAYLRGAYAGSSLADKNSMRTAIEMYERAVTLDSTFAMAYAMLAYTHLGYYWWGMTVRRSGSRRPSRHSTGPFPSADLPQAYRYSVCITTGVSETTRGHCRPSKSGRGLPKRMVFATRLHPGDSEIRGSVGNQEGLHA
jgi:TolB-like protein